MAKEFRTKSYVSNLVKCTIEDGEDVTPLNGGSPVTWAEAEQLSKAFHGVAELGNLTDAQKALIAGMIA